jgi:putative ABC transport system permease protein
MWQSGRRPSDFSAEIESHIDLEAERLRQQGLSAAAAAVAARREFGNVTRAEERFYETGHWLWWDHLKQDVRFSLRNLANSPAFTAVAVLTLALGIGATTVIFTAVYAALLKPLPFADPGRLVAVWRKNPSHGWAWNNVTPAELIAWRDESGAFDDMAAFAPTSCVLTDGGEPEDDPCELVSSNLFPLLGVSPVRGRLFSEDEDWPDSARVVILSYGLWQRRFGGDERIIGRVIDVNNVKYSVVGVMPEKLPHSYASPYLSVPSLWVAGIGLSPTRLWNDYIGIGRLKSGMSVAAAATRMDSVSARLAGLHSILTGWWPQVMSLRREVSGSLRPALTVLMGAVFFVLLIACGNVANLLLARGVARGGEFAMRRALGATRGRVVRQLLAESLVLALAGGVAGIVVAYAGCRSLVAVAPPVLLNSAPEFARGVGDPRVLAFALATTLATTVLFGLTPALQGVRPRTVSTELDAGLASLRRVPIPPARSALIVSEVALAAVVLIGAGLMVRTLAELHRADRGFSAAQVLTLRVSLTGDRYVTPLAQEEFLERTVAAIKALPGVDAASVTRGLPVTGWAGLQFTTYDHPNPSAANWPDANYVVVGPDYFRVMGIPLREGRYFDARDIESASKVVIVSEHLARTYWAGQNPIGKLLRVGPPTSPWRAVAGVVGDVGDVLTQGPERGRLSEMYLPYQQYPWLMVPEQMVLRTVPGVAPASVARAATRAIHRADPRVPVTDIEPLERLVRDSTGLQRLVMNLLVAFATLALVLSALGIFGVLAYTVSQRSREISVRAALGAQPRALLHLVCRDAALLTGAGLGIGLAAAFLLTRLMAGLLYGVRPADPLTFAAAAILLGVTSLLAAYLPARRAIAADPGFALRHE